MSFEIYPEVAGVKEALKLINTVDKSVRRKITKNYQAIMADTVTAVRAGVPGNNPPPISGFGRSWTTKTGFQVFPWNGVVSKEGVKSGTSGKQPREFAGYTRHLAAFYIRWAGTQAVVYDMAGKKGANGISEGLAKKGWGNASRLMWPTILEQMPNIEDKLDDLVKDIMVKYSAALEGKSLRNIDPNEGLS